MIKKIPGTKDSDLNQIEAEVKQLADKYKENNPDVKAEIDAINAALSGIEEKRKTKGIPEKQPDHKLTEVATTLSGSAAIGLTLAALFPESIILALTGASFGLFAGLVAGRNKKNHQDGVKATSDTDSSTKV